MLQLLPVLDQGDTFLFPSRWKVKNTRAFHETKRKKNKYFFSSDVSSTLDYEMEKSKEGHTSSRGHM